MTDYHLPYRAVIVDFDRTLLRTDKSISEYTVRVLEAWQRLRGETPSLLIGADSLRELHTWHRAPELVEKFRILTYPRGGAPVTREELGRYWPERCVSKLLSGVIPGDFFEISSSELKTRLEKITEPGDIIQLKGVLDAGVCEYIIRHRLYISGGGKAAAPERSNAQNDEEKR